MKLVIVESPAKAKTIAKYLGSDYVVHASRGHIWDLPVKSMGIDFNNNYEPELEARKPEQRETIERLKKAVKQAEQVFLATDPDREGEAISYHLLCALGLDPQQKNRIMFNEISKKAVNDAIQRPNYINKGLVDAQQARRVLDRLVGYTLSPVLCKKIRNNLSAGRVQSAALRIIVDREKEILNFKPEEYWNVSAILQKKGVKPQFKVNLTERKGKKFKITNKDKCDEALAVLNANPFVVSKVKKTVAVSKPQPPFTTSTMQQDAVNKLKMSSETTMKIAQQLYEGIDIGGEHLALVTYIRTDSVRVSIDAQNQARNYIANKYGPEYVPTKPNFYVSKKQAQDAHEAIRPINLDMTPEYIKDKVSRNQYLLYKLIYERFLASQASPATFNSTVVTVACGDYGLSASGKTPLFDGYLAIYAEAKGKTDEEKEENVTLPPLEVGDILNLVKLSSEQKFTKPPTRYTEASIIKTMEEKGIGRPSTYATIMQTLYKREYIKKDGKYLVPENLGIQVTEYLEQYFGEVVDIAFTAEMEDRLDSIEDNNEPWYKVVDSFYQPLNKKVSLAMHGEKIHVQDEVSDVLCDKCGKPMLIKTGRYGKYLACSGYPSCSNIRSLKEKTPPKQTNVLCDICGAPMLEREGRFGKYLACSNYPHCKNTKPITEVVAKCPKCGGNVVKRASKRGTIFYGCTNYPTCDFVSWDVPTGKLCPICQAPLVYKESRGKKTIVCSTKGCSYKDESNQ